MFQWFKKKNEPLVKTQKTKQDYWLVYKFFSKEEKPFFLALLNYSNECGDSDFPRVCIDIVSSLLNMSFCVKDAVYKQTDHKILLSWRIMSKKKGYKKTKVFTSQNELIEQLKQYLADYTNFAPTRYFELYVPTDSACFKEEELLNDENSKLCITYSVMSDELAIIMHAPEDVLQVVEKIEKICLSYEKNFSVKEIQPCQDTNE